MNISKHFFAFFIGFIFISIISCQTEVKETSIDRMKKDITVLASDSLKGREAGTENELKARDYIISEFRKTGLKPFFNGEYFQEFQFKDGAEFSGSTLVINGISYEYSSDFTALSKSKNDSINGELLKVGYGIMSEEPPHNDYTNHQILDGKIYIMEMSVPGGASEYEKYADVADLDKRIELASKFGAKAIILVNNDSTFNDPRKMISNVNGRTVIPVIYAKGKLLEYINQNESGQIILNVIGKKLDKTGYNIAGILDKGYEKTIIIGAHYDHLGMGGETSRYPGEAIHNGADDNASGVATVLEIARIFSKKEIKVNLLFIGFSAEEKGLYGSTYFVENSMPEIKKSVLCYINYDMVGRMDTVDPKLTIYGTGTALQWDTVLSTIADTTIDISKSPSGIGGSDQMPFYLDSVPVLFFFTGIHDQYHMPTDDEALINYYGMKKVLDYSEKLIEKISLEESLNWKATKSHSGSRRDRNGPSMGIMPDYSADGGVLVNMVIDGKPGSIAGLQKGDIITSINGKKIKDVYDYMDALKECKKEVDYPLEITRNGENQKLIIRF